MVCGSAHTHTHNTVQPRSSRRMGRGRGWSYQVPGEARQPRPREPWTARPPPVCLSRSLSPGRPPWVATSGLGGRRWTPWCACVRWSYAAPANDTRAQSARLPLHSTAVARFHPGGGFLLGVLCHTKGAVVRHIANDDRAHQDSSLYVCNRRWPPISPSLGMYPRHASPQVALSQRAGTTHACATCV